GWLAPVTFALVRRTGPILIAVIGLLALVIDFWPNLSLPALTGDAGGRKVETKLGLDLQGGLKVEYRVDPNGDRQPTLGDVEVVKQIIERRVNATGVSEPVVVTSGTDRIVVEVPGISDTAAIRRLVGQTGQLQFVPIPSSGTPPTQGTQLTPGKAPCPTSGDPTTTCVLFGGEELQSANVGSDQQGRRTVNFVLKDKGKNLFSAWTAAHVQDYFAIVLDNVVISAPQINEAIPGGSVQISAGGLGGFTKTEADELTNVLRFGSLPFPVEELASDTIDPTLGQEFLNSSLLAGGIAIILVVLFMLIHYRLPGVVASFALVYYAILTLALFRLIPVTLTLAGIAGFVLSVGMAVDANILIFERTKEELRSGKSLAQAIEAGFARAWNSILDSNVSSLITAMILYLFGSSVIQGFALVLILGVLASIFTAIVVTPLDPARHRPARVGPQGVALRRHGRRVHRPPDDARRAAPRGSRCLTSSGSAAGSSCSRC
ncbi:MAG TPA: protein translocase subunit SecD, partial [Patescibacteria group bacterium]|nr:protein translocase subunit SecD [Patescibacteria group bacterium]